MNNRARCEDQLRVFVRKAWKIIEPITQFVPNWHIDLVCEYLTACTIGQIRRLVINLPPRNSKSVPTSIMWPCWSWIKQPATRWIFTSHSAKLSTEHSIKRRTLLMSDWYQARWGHQVKMRDDRNLLDHYENVRGGACISTSMQSGIAGFGCEYLVVDDAHDTNNPESEADRLAVLRSFDQAFSTRLNNKKTGVIVIIMQRLHTDDLSGHVLKESGWEHLRLPMEAEGQTRVYFPLSGRIQDRADGELLNPNREGPEQIAEYRIRLGAMGFAGQMQQSPVPSSGNIIKPEWFKVYKTLPEKFDRTLLSADTAFKTKEENDWTAITCWGVYQGQFYVLDLLKTKVEFPALKQLAVSMYFKWNRPDAFLIEDKASGSSLIQELRMPITMRDSGEMARLPIVPIKIDTDKIARAQAAAPMVEAGQVSIPDAAIFNVPWLATFLTDLSTFPVGDGADTMDSVSQALNYLRGGGMWAGLQEYQRNEIARIKSRADLRPVCSICGERIGDNLPFYRDMTGSRHAVCPNAAAVQA